MSLKNRYLEMGVLTPSLVLSKEAFFELVDWIDFATYGYSTESLNGVDEALADVDYYSDGSYEEREFIRVVQEGLSTLEPFVLGMVSRSDAGLSQEGIIGDTLKAAGSKLARTGKKAKIKGLRAKKAVVNAAVAAKEMAKQFFTCIKNMDLKGAWGVLKQSKLLNALKPSEVKKMLSTAVDYSVKQLQAGKEWVLKAMNWQAIKSFVPNQLAKLKSAIGVCAKKTGKKPEDLMSDPIHQAFL